MPEVDQCYEAWLRLQPRLSGRINLRFSIDTDDGIDGRVTQVSTGDAGVGNLAFEGCVLSVVAALRFEPPMNGKLDVTYPLVFVAPPPTSNELRAELATLCLRIRNEALRVEHARVAPADLLTTVLVTLARQTSSFQQYFDALLPGDVPPLQRKETFKRAISTAIGAPWACPDFEALWEGRPIAR